MENISEPASGNKLSFLGMAPSGYCKEHTKEDVFFSADCECRICNHCVAGSHFKCRILSTNGSFIQQKEKFTKMAKSQLGKIDAQKVHEDLVLKALEQKRRAASEKIDRINRDMADRVERLISLGVSIRDIQLRTTNLSKFQETLKTFNSSIQETESNLDLLKDTTFRLEVDSEQLRQILNEIILPRELVSHFTINDLQDLCEDGSVFTVRCPQGVPQYGKVAVKGDHIWIHSFQPRKPQENHILITFRQLLLKFNKSFKLPMKAFLQIADASSVYGEFVIATKRLTPRSLDFLILCSGIKGRSYEGHKLNNPDWVDAIGIVSDSEGGAVVKGIRDGGI